MEEASEECHVAIDAVECTSCSYVACFDEEGAEYKGYKIDCSDIDESLVFECHAGADLFDILIDASFDVCIPYNATNTLATGVAGSDDSITLLDGFDQPSGVAIDPPSPSMAPISEPSRGPSIITSITPEPTLPPPILDSAARSDELDARQVLTLILSITVSARLINCYCLFKMRGQVFDEFEFVVAQSQSITHDEALRAKHTVDII